MQSPLPLVRLLFRVCVRLGLGLVLLVGLCVVVAGVSLHAYAASSATLTVTDCSGENGPGQIGTVLSSASAGDTITFSCSGTIPITSPLSITKNLTLDGSGQSVTLDGGNNTQVLFVNGGVSFTLKALTIAHGIAGAGGASSGNGGGLDNEGGTVTISTSTFANNSTIGGPGGGLYTNGGTVTISNSTFSGNSNNGGGPGGGLYNDSGGTVTISNSTFSGNTAQDSGGGLFSSGGTVTISNSTFSGNSAPSEGGGLYNQDSTVNITTSTFSSNSAPQSGGGLFNQGGTVSISNSTFANNSTGDLGGGLFSNARTVSISNSTFANNSALQGGGLSTFATVNISASTFANNSASQGGGLDNEGGTVNIGGSIVANNPGGNCSNNGPITSTGYNLESGPDCGFTSTGDQQNTDPKLDPNGLQNNGGPTQTIALQQDSPAIDVIPTSSNLCSVTDQRGNSRPDDNESSCDMGAYESNYVSLSLNGTNVNATESSRFTGAVASGTYSGSGTLSASIDWGDGASPSTGTVNQSGSSFTVSGSHTYAEEGNYTINVSVSDGQGQSTSTTSPATVSDAALTLTHFVAGRLGHRWAGVAATFTDADPAGTVSDYTATITWGDGTTSTVKVYKNPFGKSFVLAGVHRYAKKGKYTVTLTVTDQGGSTLSKTTTITVK